VFVSLSLPFSLSVCVCVCVCVCSKLAQDAQALNDQVQQAKAEYQSAIENVNHAKARLNALKPAGTRLTREQVAINAQLSRLEQTRKQEQPPDISEMEGHKQVCTIPAFS
jgi:septal ring factor EnvC (AmiA/AmiB activator)